MKRPYADSDLRAYAQEHVAYEVDMLFWTGSLISDQAMAVGGSPAEARRVANLAVEGFAIHLRNVLDFLFTDSPRSTDVVAADYCAPGAWESVRPRISPTLEEGRVRANKEMAHLTTERQAGTSPAKKWNAAVLIAELKPLLKSFVSTAKPATLSPELTMRL